MSLGILKLGDTSFQITDASLELFVEGELLFVGIQVTTLARPVEVGDLLPSWAPELVIDRLFSMRQGARAFSEIGLRRTSWGASEAESPGSIRIYESEMIERGDVALEIRQDRQTLRLHGAADLLCGEGFDRDVQVELSSQLSKVVFFAGSLPESNARAELGLFMEHADFVFSESDGISQLELTLAGYPAQSSVAPEVVQRPYLPKIDDDSD